MRATRSDPCEQEKGQLQMKLPLRPLSEPGGLQTADLVCYSYAPLYQLADSTGALVTTMVSVTKLIGVKRRAPETSECANASTLAAAGDAADSGAEPSTNTQRQFIAVLLPEGATTRRATVIVVNPPVGIPANRCAIRSDPPRRGRAVVRRAVVLGTDTALIPLVKTLSISRLFFRGLELSAILSGNLIRRFRHLIRRLVSRRVGICSCCSCVCGRRITGRMSD